MLDDIDLFPSDLLDAVRRTSEVAASEDVETARAARRVSRLHARRAKSEAHLAEILPARFAHGESWHVISHGDIDSLSYLPHAIQGVRYFDRVLISTWCMAKPDLDQLTTWLDQGKIDTLDLYVGEIFPNQYGDEYAQALAIAAQYGGKVIVARNHSKISLMSNTAEGYYLVTESSANVNTNPRIDQTAIHASRDLHDFYADFFAGLKNIDRRRQS